MTVMTNIRRNVTLSLHRIEIRALSRQPITLRRAARIAVLRIRLVLA